MDTQAQDHIAHIAHIADTAQRFRTTLMALNTRIVFLAQLVGVRLECEGEVQNILNRAHPVFRQGAQARASNANAAGHRTAHRVWEELRGLIVLRCDVVTRALEALGLGLTHEITSQVESGLNRKGIKPGSDGFDLYLLMDRAVVDHLARANSDLGAPRNH